MNARLDLQHLLAGADRLIRRLPLERFAIVPNKLTPSIDEKFVTRSNSEKTFAAAVGWCTGGYAILSVGVRTCCMYLLLLTSAMAQSGSREATTDDTLGPTQYRRVFVPADHVAAWPGEGRKLLPIEEREFNALVRAANAAARDHGSSAIIEEAFYSARLEGDSLVEGRGHWIITNHKGDEPGFLPLADMSLVLRGAQWEGAPERSVQLGRWGANGQIPESVGLQVPQNGTLTFSWTMPIRRLQNVVEIDASFPHGNATRIVLDLPADNEPLAEDGVVQAKELPIKPASHGGIALRRWEIALSPSAKQRLRIFSLGSAPAKVVPPVGLREETNYRITQRGLEMDAVWSFHRGLDDCRELIVPLAAGVQLVSAQAAERMLKWRTVKDEPSGAESAVIELPEGADPQKIVLQAWQAPRLDELWLLPKLHPVGASWQGGTAHVQVAAPLELQSLEHNEAVQASRDDYDGSEVHTLALYGPNAQVAVRVAQREPQARLWIGSTMSFTDIDVSGRLATRWSLDDGALHTLTGELADGWEIESVESVPPEARGEWFVFRQPEGNRLEVQLTRSVRRGRGITLIISGRFRRGEPNKPFAADMLRMVRWDAARVARHLLTFQAAERFGVEAQGNIPLLASEALEPDDRTLLNLTADNAQVFDLTRASASAGLMLVRKRGQYEAQIEIDVACRSQQSAASYRLTIVPKTDNVDRLLVYASAPLGEDVRWIEEASGVSLVSERLAENQADRRALGGAGETWLLRLPRPADQAVNVTMQLTKPLAAKQQLPLIALPEAQRQTAHISIRGEMHSLPALEPQFMHVSPPPAHAGAADSAQGTVGLAFRYEPADVLTSGRAPQLSLSPSDAPIAGRPIVRRLNLESYFSATGGALHRARYELERTGSASIALRPPADALLRTAILDGRRLELPASGEWPSSLSLPAGDDLAAIELYFETADRPLTAGGELLPPLLHHNLPVLSGEWILWLPADYSATGSQLVAGAEDLTWRQRLFGMLARPYDGPVFHPLRLPDWSRAVGPMSLPWSDEEETLTASAPVLSSAHEPAASHGWRSYRQSFVANGPAPVSIAAPPTIGAWAGVAFLLAVVGGGQLRQQSPRLFVTGVTVTALMALFLPAAIAPIATGALWGLGLSLIPLSTKRKSLSDSPDGSWSRPSTVGAASLLLALAMSGLATAGAANNNKSPDEDPSPAVIEPVLIPVNAIGELAGSKYYVSDRLLRELLRRASSPQQEIRQWLLRDATYAGELRVRSDASGVVCDDWTLMFDVETLVRDTQVTLPLLRQEASWTQTAMLDGAPLPLEWAGDERSCSVQISEPGRYLLTLTCVPRTSTVGRYELVKLSVPAVADARLQIGYPTELAGLIVAERDVTASELAAGAIEHEIGPTEQLNVRWPRQALATATSTNLQVTGLRWLHVGAEQVDLLAKYVIEGSGRRPQFLTVVFDRRWQLVPDAVEGASPTVANEPDDKKSVNIPLSDAEAERQEVTLRWRLADATYLGRLQLPPVELVTLPVTQRWLAISSDRSLECEVTGGSTSAGSVNEFLAMWGDTDAAGRHPHDGPPQLVLGDFRTNVPWSVALRPRQRETTIDEVLHIAAGRHVLQVAYHADVVPGRPHEFQFSLAVPATFAIDDVTLTQGTTRVPVRWSRADPRRLNVFFQERLASEYRLAVRGSVRASTDAAQQLPRISTAASTTATQHVQLYREDDTLVEVEGGLNVEQSAEGMFDPPPGTWTARPVGALRVTSAAAEQLRLKITPNNLMLAGDMLIALTRQREGWWASFHARLNVETGQLDVLRVRLPDSWPGPYTIESDVPAAMEVDASVQQSPVLVIRFAQSVAPGEKVAISISGPLSRAVAPPISVPEILPELQVRGRRFVAVPKVIDAAPAKWATAGVQPVELPRHFQSSLDSPTDIEVYQASGAAFRVSLRAPDSRSILRVRLVDTRVTIGSRGGQLVETSFTLAAPDLAHCTIQVPNEQELVSVRLDGEPIGTRRVADHQWQILMGPTMLPRLLMVITRSVTPVPSSTPHQLQRPMLVARGAEIPVELSLWSVNYPRVAGHARLPGVATLSEREQAAVRLERLVSIMEMATTTAAQLPAPDGVNWFRRWADRLTAMSQKIESAESQPSGLRPPAQVAAPGEEDLDSTVNRLGQWLEQSAGIFAPHEGSAEALETDDRITGFPDVAIETANTTSLHGVAEGGPSTLPLELRLIDPSDSQSRWLALAAVGAIALGSLWVMNRPVIADLLLRWPHAMAFLFGLAYWAWLRPSWLGLVLAAASLVLAWRHPWPGRSLPIEGSTVLRPAQPEPESQ